MRSVRALFSCCLLSCCLLSAVSLFAEQQCPSLSFDIGAGWRQDELRFSMAGPNRSPNFQTFIKWENIRMYGLGGKARYVSEHHYVIQLEADCAKAYHGHNVERIYTLDDKKGESSQIASKAARGHVYDLSAAVGYQLMSTGRRCLATVLAGYMFNHQQFHAYNGKQRIDGAFVGPESGNYRSRWYGAFLGLDLATRIECNGSLYASFAWHIPQFTAEGNWNLRDGLLGKINQRASAWGYDATLGFSWDFNDRFGVGIMSKFKHMHTHGGSARPELVVNNVLTKVHTKLNTVRWQSVLIYLSLYGRF